MNWVLDADIKGFFHNVDRMLRLFTWFIHAGVMIQGAFGLHRRVSIDRIPFKTHKLST